MTATQITIPLTEAELVKLIRRSHSSGEVVPLTLRLGGAALLVGEDSGWAVRQLAELRGLR